MARARERRLRSGSSSTSWARRGLRPRGHRVRRRPRRGCVQPEPACPGGKARRLDRCCVRRRRRGEQLRDADALCGGVSTSRGISTTVAPAAASAWPARCAPSRSAASRAPEERRSAATAAPIRPPTTRTAEPAAASAPRGRPARTAPAPSPAARAPRSARRTAAGVARSIEFTWRDRDTGRTLTDRGWPRRRGAPPHHSRSGRRSST